MFFGHTHYDQFQLHYSDYSARTAANALVTSYLAPSLTPTSGQPAFRVYTVDPVTFAVLDTTTYTADMDDPAFQTTGPVWKKYYSAKEAYGAALNPPVTDPAAELTAAFWHNVTVAFESDPALYGQYVARKRRGWKIDTCTGDCARLDVCAIRAGRAQDNCDVPTPGIHFNKRAENLYEERDECGISVARASLGSVVVRRDVLEHLARRFVEEGALVDGEAVY